MNNIIACIDHSPAAETVCDYASWASLQLDAPLTFLHVLDDDHYPAPQDFSGNIGLGSREHLLERLATLDEERGRLAREHGQHLLDDAKQRARDAGVEKPHCSQRHGDLVDSLKELESDIRLLIMGRQGESSAELADQVGSQIESVVRSLSRPILVVPKTFAAPHRFVIAFDGSPTSRKCVEMIASSPLFRAVECHLLMVGERDNEAQQQMTWASELLSRAGFKPTQDIRQGIIEDTILQYCDQVGADVLAMGAYGHSRIRQFLVGSTTSHLLARTRLPLLLLR